MGVFQKHVGYNVLILDLYSKLFFGFFCKIKAIAYKPRKPMNESNTEPKLLMKYMSPKPTAAKLALCGSPVGM